MGNRSALRRALLAATRSMVQGGLTATTRRCGKATCSCAHDPTARHGPHIYLTYRDEAGVSRSLYVPPQHAEEAEAARQAWARFWKIGCALALENREALRRTWQRETGRPPRSRRRRD